MPESQVLLVIDDSEAERAVMAETLGAAFPDAHVRSAAHPRAAIKMCKEDTFDCVLLDYNMPEMNGVELAGELRSQSGYLPIILMTSVGDEMLAAAALHSGVSDYIPKSRITADSIRRAVDRSIQVCLQTRLIEEQRGELENFAYALAHDFKQPIRQIMTFSQMIADALADQEVGEVPQNLAFLGDAARRLGKLVDVMSQYTLLNQPPELSNVDLNRVLATVRASLSPYLAERGAELVFTRRAPTIRGDETLMTQVLQNLIVNGLQYNRSEVPRIDVTAERQSDHWVLNIRDNGLGIQAEHLTEIFKPLIRLHTASDYPGTGLGLTLARKAVLAQNGSIWCESTPGEGSVFHIQLPEAAERDVTQPRKTRTPRISHPVKANLVKFDSRTRPAPRTAPERSDTQSWHTLTEEVAGVGSWRLDVATDTERWSDGLFGLYGFDANKPLDLESAKAAVHPDDRDRAHSLLQRALEHGEDYTDLYRLKRADGSWRVLRSRVICTRAAIGPVATVFGIVTDVTEQEALKAQLLDKREQTDAAMNAKAEFLGNMSHEIRTPLTAIIGFAGLLEGLPKLPETATTYVRRISQACIQLMRVVNEVLDFSRLDAGQMELDPEPVNLADLAIEALNGLRKQAMTKGVDLRTNFATGLPEWVLLDADRFRQVLLGVAGNAIKFTTAGSVTVILANDATDVLKVSVTDTGPGVALELQRGLFERFSQVDSSIDRDHGGIGLGLATSKGLVELMGGSIGVQSAPGLGSTFWFTVAAPSVHKPLSAPAVPRSLPAPIRILVVDDVSVNRVLVRAMLEPLHYALEEAVNGQDAVKAAKEQLFDLILMDLQMPGMDGLEATRMIRSTAGANRDTPIVAFSANGLPELVEACYAAGMNGHLPKPISPGLFLLAVAKWAGPVPPRTSQASQKSQMFPR